MTANRYYSSTAQPTSLASAISAASGVSVVIISISGLPTSYPYTLAIDWGTTSQELITVTAAPTGSGPYTFTSANVLRGEDGTTAQTHLNGATVAHTISARDFAEPQAHMITTSGVHGVSGALVGTTDVQTLSNKTLTQPVIADFTNANHDHSNTVGGGSVAGSATTTLGTGVGQWQFDVKGTNQSVTNSTTLVNDNDLSISVTTNATYVLEMWLYYQGVSGGDFKIGFSSPSGTYNFSGAGWGTAATTDAGDVARFTARASGDATNSLALGCISTSTQSGALIRGLVETGATSGNFQFKFAQNTANTTATTLLANSWMTLFRII